MYLKLMKAGCTGCRYCLPCPADVAIPVCLELYNDLHMLGNLHEAKRMYAARLSDILSGGKTGYASQCTQCEQCLEKCPQHLDIPRLLEFVADELEGPDLETRLAAVRQIFADASPSA